MQSAPKGGGKRENFSVSNFSYKKQSPCRHSPALSETWLKKYLVLLAKPMVTL
ncbi:hypothetical protein [Salmonella enterica]|uniref:hypothetical protein n=1 Tax=Salmonella enterica TaxID=28901 RepID=UPI00042258FF|nr:hypothetical protein [Salmonella enterica]